jgi:hypothetical protein
VLELPPSGNLRSYPVVMEEITKCFSRDSALDGKSAAERMGPLIIN